MTTKMSPVAQGILKGLNEALAHAAGEPTTGTKETIIYSADAKAIRNKLTMPQTEFAETYAIPLATLKNWEQGRRRPDATASAYLWAIEKYPQEIKAVQKAKSDEHAYAACAM